MDGLPPGTWLGQESPMPWPVKQHVDALILTLSKIHCRIEKLQIHNCHLHLVIEYYLWSKFIIQYLLYIICRPIFYSVSYFCVVQNKCWKKNILFLYFVFCILYFVFCILYSVFCILYFVFCILFKILPPGDPHGPIVPPVSA